ncbi:hypothetical protein [Salibaculum griseiflavum]|uniref:LTXXQ motif family protein n=1 Tax=Salibaculum griseiflavum TaxID=1914409 RepID=A0A2V1P369_9RHOB|nr:hypothetical protein [Salibaculum griseiflavum]PWG16855.1 hypothetical protein DFK10_10025 [Salibaculum griseiflavum]
MKRFVLSAAALAIALPVTGLAQQNGPDRTALSQPVIALTGVLNKNADAVGLDEDQRAILADWIATMPAQRKALEDETLALRADLRAAIISNAPKEEREAIAARIGENETALVMMRSNCADHWRNVLTPDQFAMLLELAGAA